MGALGMEEPVSKNGRIDMLQWARANGCPLDKMACAQAALSGCLHVLKWAREIAALGMKAAMPLLLRVDTFKF